ncbi:MAG: zinc ABC transporter substrate-binding protein [Nitrososphaera sp.]|jgi:zinc transport system substrate-binding protein
MDDKIIIGIAAAAAVAVVIPFTIMTDDTPNDVTPEVAGDQKIRVVASFFPLYDFARQVGGDRADVTSMVPAGVEPHDWEPTIRQISDAQSADLFIFNGVGFESWARDIGAKAAVDASSGLDLLEGERRGAFDSHIWLDPVLAKQQVEKIRDGFVKVDPENAQYYNDNAARFTAELDALDASIRSELSECEKQDFIAFHNAFSYFANRYGLTQHAVHGGLPEGEIAPQRLQEVVNLANELKLDTIYAEELVDPRLAEIIASEIPGGKVLVLSPIEGLDDEELRAGLGYIDKMEQNLVNLKAGLKCR